MCQSLKMMKTALRFIYNLRKEQSMNKKLSEMPIPAYARIVEEWYRVMGENNISVQPKASTILGTILAQYDITPKQHTESDVYEQFMNTTGGNFTNFWENLSDVEKAYVEERRKTFRDKFYAEQHENDKQLLRG